MGCPPVVEDLTSTDFCCRRDWTGAWMVPLAAEVATWTKGGSGILLNWFVDCC